MRYYLKILSFLYCTGVMLHILDLFDLRLKFSEMSIVWKMWIIYLIAGDMIASIGLYRQKIYGEIAFLIIGLSQIFAYTIFESYFGNQNALIVFHLITISIYLFFKNKKSFLRL